MSDPKVLLAMHKKGDTKAITELIESYKQELYDLCFRLSFNEHDADDLFQQTWLKIIKNPHKFVGNSFRNWLYTICINAHKDKCRKQARMRKNGVVEFKHNNDKNIAMSLVTSNISAEDKVQENFINTKLLSLVNKLPSKQKSVIVLYYFQDFSVRRIGRILGIPDGTVKSRLNTTRKKLHSQMLQVIKEYSEEEKINAKY